MKCTHCGKRIPPDSRQRKYCSAACRQKAARQRNKPAPVRHLHAVESPPPGPRVLSVARAAREGTELEQLMAMRDRLADAITDPKCPPRDLAALTRRLEELRKEIAAERLRLKEERADAVHVADEAWDEAAI